MITVGVLTTEYAAWLKCTYQICELVLARQLDHVVFNDEGVFQGTLIIGLHALCPPIVTDDGDCRPTFRPSVCLSFFEGTYMAASHLRAVAQSAYVWLRLMRLVLVAQSA